MFVLDVTFCKAKALSDLIMLFSNIINSSSLEFTACQFLDMLPPSATVIINPTKWFSRDDPKTSIHMKNSEMVCIVWLLIGMRRR